MLRSSWFARLGFAVVLACLCTGCGKNWTMNEQVEGTATLDGKPLAGVVVQFVPDVDSKLQPPMSHGTTDEKGHFVLTCDNSKSGAVVGKHSVVIMPGRGEGADSKTATVPAIYKLAAKTPLKKEITADEHNYKLELSSKIASEKSGTGSGAGAGR